MINANFFIGRPITFKNICKVYPPRINDIIDNQDYPIYRQILLQSQEDIEDYYAEKQLPMDEVPTPLQYLFIVAAIDEKSKQLVKNGFEFFIKEPVNLLMDKQLIVIGDLKTELAKVKEAKDLRIIKEDNFFELQNLMRASIGEKEVEPYNPNEHPKVKYFKAKARLRDRVKAKSKDNLTLGSTLAAICCMDLNLNPLNIGELSQAAISVLIRYYQEKQKYEIDIKSLLAGADSKKVKPQNWIRNIEDL